MKHETVERETTPVLFTSRRDSMPNAPRKAFEELEAKIGSLRGRKFYGVFDPVANEYRACVERKPGDDAARLGLQEGAIPGGRYATDVLRGEPPEVYGLIAGAFERLIAASSPDDARPSVEFYRRRDEIVILLPIQG